MDPGDPRRRLQVVLPERNDGWGFVRGNGIRHEFQSHAHASLTLGTVVSGRRRIVCRELSWEAGVGEAFCIAPWRPHSCVCDAPAGHDYLVVSVSAGLLAECAPDEDGLSCPRTGPLPDSSALRRLFACADPDSGRGSEFPEVLRDFLEECRRDGRTEAAAGPSPLCDDACRYLLSQLDSSVSLDELAEYVGASPYYFHRLFRAGTGMPPHAWHLQARVREAIDRLVADVPIQKVALDLGFSDQSHFNRVFRKAMGVPPGLLEAPEGLSPDGTPP